MEMPLDQRATNEVKEMRDTQLANSASSIKPQPPVQKMMGPPGPLHVFTCGMVASADEKGHR